MTTRSSHQNWLAPLVRPSRWSVLLSLSISAGLAMAAPGLTITSPIDGQPAPQGKNLSVTVTISGGTLAQVVVLGEGAIGLSNIRTASPFTFSLPIPARLPAGHYTLTAIGVDSSGNMVKSAPVGISVERPDAPLQIDVRPTTLTVPVGGRVPLRVIGTYADGARIDITRSILSTFVSTAPNVASVDSQGAVTAVVPGTASIFVDSSISIPLTVPPALVVSPQWPILYGSRTSQFSVVSPGMPNPAVHWTINPAIGSVSPSGLYKAPSSILSQTLVNITGTLVNDPSQFISTKIVLFPPLQVQISPLSASLTAGQTARFAQSFSNASDNNVMWSVSPKGVGTIDAGGLYTAPAAIKKQQTVTIAVTAAGDPTKSASAIVTLNPLP